MVEFPADPRIEPLSRVQAEQFLKGQPSAIPALRLMLARFERLFALHSPFAPGLACIGGTIFLRAQEQEAFGAPVLSATGNGLDLPSALISCLGEAAEYLSSVEAPGDGAPLNRRAAAPAGWIASAARNQAASVEWMEALNAATGETIRVPADFCLRRAPQRRVIEPVGALSAGVAAGPDFMTAAERAILELIERDAAALWQFGGRRPARAGRQAAAAAKALLEKLRQGASAHTTRLLDITTDAGVPVIAAWSADPGGAGMACGIAARRTSAAAAEAAVLELAQMEMAASLSAMKLSERGEGALSKADRRHLSRSNVKAADHPLFQPDSSAKTQQLIRPDHNLAFSLAQRGFEIYLVDLTRENIGVAAARALSPELQPYSGAAVTKRLRALTKKRRPQAAVEIY